MIVRLTVKDDCEAIDRRQLQLEPFDANQTIHQSSSESWP